MSGNVATFDHNHVSAANSITTASKTWTAGRVYFITVQSTSPATTTTPTVTGTTSGSPASQVSTQIASGNQDRQTFFVYSPASTTTETFTISFGGINQTLASYVIDELTGVIATGTNGVDCIRQKPTFLGNSGTIAWSFSPFLDPVNNLTYLVAGNHGSDAQATPTGFTLSTTDSTFTTKTWWRIGADLAPTSGITGSTIWLATGIEVLVVGATPAAPPPFVPSIPMRPGPDGFTHGTPFAQSGLPPVPKFTQPSNAPPAFQMSVPMMVGPGGFVGGAPYAGATTKPVPFPPPKSGDFKQRLWIGIGIRI